MPDSFAANTNRSLSVDKFQPMLERAQDRPQVLAGLTKLKQQLTEEDFEKYINHVQTINLSGETLLIIAGGERRKTFIEARFIPAIREAFNVKRVRVVGGGGYGSSDVF